MKKILVIGYGSIAQRHVSLLKKLIPQTQVTVSRSSIEKAKKPLDNIEEVIGPDLPTDLENLDMAFICNPSPYHLDYLQPLIDANIPTFCEKPLTNSVEKLEHLRLKKQGFENKVLVGYVLRYAPSLKYVKSIVENQSYGKVLSVQVDVGQYLPRWRKSSDYRLDVSGRKDLGGGSTLELSHEIDYINWIFGAPKELIGREAKLSSLEIDVPDTTDCLYFYNDFNIHLHMDMYQRETTRKMKIVFEEANLTWDFVKKQVEINSETQGANKCKVFGQVDIYHEQLKHFLNICDDKDGPNVSLDDASQVVELIEKIRVSSQMKRPIEV